MPNAMADKLFVSLHYSIYFNFILIYINSFFLLGRSDQKSGGAASQLKGAVSQNGTQLTCKNIPCLSRRNKDSSDSERGVN